MSETLRIHLEALRGCLENLEDTIRRLLGLTQSLPIGETRDRLLEEISCLDSIGDVMRRGLDAMEQDHE